MFYSCATTTPQYQDRHVASVLNTDRSCQGLMRVMLHETELHKLDNDLSDYILRESKQYWGWHDNVTWWRIPADHLTRVRRRMVKWFKGLNANPVPVVYIEDGEATLASIIKYESSFKQKSSPVTDDLVKDVEASALADGNVEKWISRYETYPDRLTRKLREHLALDYAIKDLEKLKSSLPSDFPTKIVEYKLLVPVDEGKPELGTVFKKVPFPFNSKVEITNAIRDLKRDRKKIVSKLMSRGSRREIVVQQAKDRKRLIMLRDRLVKLKLYNDANDIDYDIKLNSSIEKINYLLDERTDLKPSQNIVMRIEFGELMGEFRALFSKLKQSSVNENFQKIIETLTEAEKRALGLDQNGLAGNVMLAIRNHPARALALTIATGSAVGVADYFEVFKDLFTSDYNKRQECIQESKEKNMIICLERYLTEKFALKAPLKLSAEGFPGLINAMLDNENVTEEFKEILDIIVKERVEKVTLDREIAEARTKLLVVIQEAVEQANEEREKRRQNPADVN